MRTLLPVVLVILALAAIPASAQPVISAKSGLIPYTQGEVFLGDQAVEIAPNATKFPEMKENDVLRTQDGLAEVLLPPGFILRLGDRSSFRMITNRLIDTRIELLTGSAIIEALDVGKETPVTVVCKDATITVARSGHYRFDSEPGRLRVYAGLANVELAGQTVAVGSGKMVTLAGVTAASVEKFDKNQMDALENWSQRRSQLSAMASPSAARRGGCRSGLMAGSGCWSWNPYFGLYTYIPWRGHYCDPFWGYCYYSPEAAYRLYYHPPAQTASPGFGAPSYPTMGATSSGYSGAMASGSGASSSPAAAASSGSSSAASSGTSSVGHGSAGSGGRGH